MTRRRAARPGPEDAEVSDSNDVTNLNTGRAQRDSGQWRLGRGNPPALRPVAADADAPALRHAAAARRTTGPGIAQLPPPGMPTAGRQPAGRQTRSPSPSDRVPAHARGSLMERGRPPLVTESATASGPLGRSRCGRGDRGFPGPSEAGDRGDGGRSKARECAAAQCRQARAGRAGLRMQT